MTIAQNVLLASSASNCFQPPWDFADGSRAIAEILASASLHFRLRRPKFYVLLVNYIWLSICIIMADKLKGSISSGICGYMSLVWVMDFVLPEDFYLHGERIWEQIEEAIIINNLQVSTSTLPPRRGLIQGHLFGIFSRVQALQHAFEGCNTYIHWFGCLLGCW